MKKRLIILVALFVCSGWLGLPGFSTVPSDKTPSEQAKSEEKPFAIKVDVNLVVLNVTVLDEKGTNVTNLKREDFAVYEDDTEPGSMWDTSRLVGTESVDTTELDALVAAELARRAR